MQVWLLFFSHRKVGLQPGPPEGEYTCRHWFCSLHIRKLVFSQGLQKGNIHAGVGFVFSLGLQKGNKLAGVGFVLCT